MNMPTGTAADIIKKVMNSVHYALKEGGYRSNSYFKCMTN